MGSQWGCLGRQLVSTAVRRFVAFFGVWPNSRVLRQRLSGPRTSCSSGTSCRQPAFSQPVGAPGQRNDFGRWSQQRPLSIGGSVGWVGHPYGDCGASFCSHPVPLPFPVLPLGPRAFQPARVSWPRPAQALVSVRSNLKKESVMRRKRFECPLPGIVNCYFSIVRLVAADQRTRISGTSCSPCSIPKASCVPISPSLISIAPRLDVAWSWLARPGLVMCGLVWCDRRLYHDMFGPGMVWHFSR